MKKTIVNLLTMAIVISAVMLSCKPDPDDTPKVCTCPNGTLHLVGETCCNEVGCVCEKDVAGQRIEGIAVTNREDMSDEDFGDMFDIVEDGLDLIKSSENGQYAYMLPIIKKHIAEIRVVPGPFIGAQPVVTTNNNGNYMIVILEGTDADTIGNAFYDFVTDHPELE